MAAEAWHARQTGQQRHRLRQLVGLTRRQPEGDRPTGTVRDHASLAPIATTRAAIGLRPIPRRDAGTADRCFTTVSLCCSSPFRAAPAAFWWARTLVPSTNAIPSCTPRSWTRPSRRSQTPSRAQRLNVCGAIHHDRQSQSSVPRGQQAAACQGDRARPGSSATWHRSRGARESPRPSAAGRGAASSLAGGISRPAAPEPTTACLSASSPPHLAARQRLQDLRACLRMASMADAP